MSVRVVAAVRGLSPTLLPINGRTLSGVTRRAEAGSGPMRIAGSRSIEPLGRSRWRLRRTRGMTMGVESCELQVSGRAE